MVKMKFRALRFNSHHLAVAAAVIIIIGMLAAGWPLWPGVVVVGVLLALVIDSIMRPSSNMFYPTVTHGPRASQCVALSFDDGPDPQVTPRLLDVLAAHDAQATFFVIGRALAAHPELGRRMVAEGHVLGNHSWQHSRLQNFRFRHWQDAEIEACEQAIDAVAGQARHALYRPPMGLKIGALCPPLWCRRLTLVAWSIRSLDTRMTSAERIAGHVLSRVRAGDIILLHDGHDRPGHQRPLCVETVELLLRGLDEKNLHCVTIPQLLSYDPNGVENDAITSRPN